MSTPTITNPLSKIGDVIRGSLIADRPEQIPHLFQSIAEQITAQGGKFYIKNFWDDPKPLSLGYVGIHIKIRMPIPSEKTNAASGTPQKRRYILLEVQLHVKAIMDGTEDCAKEIAHRLYKAPKEAGDEAISPEIISSSQLVYLTAMTRLLSSKEDLEIVENALHLVQQATKADKKMRLILETVMLLGDKSLANRLGRGEWNERLQVIVPKDKDAVAAVWMETASKINKMIHLPIVRMDERDDWTNTATSVQEIYADAAEIAPFFRKMCSQAANSQPGCSVNFGPDNGYMIKKQASLLDKMQADQEEELGQFITQLLQKIGRSWAQITENNAVPFGRFSQLQSLNFSGCSQVTDTDLSFLESLSALQTLSFSGCSQVTDEGLTNLERLTRLRSLNLSGCRITDRGLSHLWRLTGLQSLNLYGCDEITADGMARAGLQSLNLSRQGTGPVLNPKSPQSPEVTNNPQSPKDAYLALLLQLLENSSVKSDSSLVEILEREADQLMDQETTDLTSRQNKSYQLVQKLLVDQKVSQFLAKKLRELHPPEESKSPPVALHALTREHQSSPNFQLLKSPPVSPQTQGSVNQRWITPKEQLKRLDLDSLEEDLAASATLWYTALTRLAKVCPTIFPKAIPPLPADIIQILDSRCPIYADQMKPDGTPYKIKDTHVLALIPQEFGSLNQLEETVLKPYEKANYPNETPLRFFWFFHTTRQQHGGVSFARTHWVLMSKDVLPESRNKTWYEQAPLVCALSIKAKIAYTLPTLQQSFAIFVTHKVATDKSLYQNTYTRVTQMGPTGGHLAFGLPHPVGVYVADIYDDDRMFSVGVSAVWEL